MKEKYYSEPVMMTASTTASEPMERISLSVPRSLIRRFDSLIDQRGFESRSQGVSELLMRELDRHACEEGSNIMTGAITLVYAHSKRGIKKRLADIQYGYLEEVISSLHVHLEDERTMEVVLVQGRANKLRKIADDLITTKGVMSGSMTLSSTLMPPIQYPQTKETNN